MGVVWAMLAVDIIIFTIIAFYVDSIKPGKFGVAQKWYFPFQKSFWFPSWTKFETSEDTNDQSTYFESEPEGLEAGIIVRGLKKVFKNLRRKSSTLPLL